MAPPFLKQAWTVSGVLLNTLGQGMVLSYSSCLLPGLRAPDSSIKPDLQTASWLASCVGISCFFGFVLSSFLMDWLGRKITHALVIVPATIGWLFIYFSPNVTTLMIGRILGGVTGGATVTLGAVVIGEYTSPENRGAFLNLKTAAICMGNTFVHILGNYFHWRTVAIFALIPHIAAFIIVCTWPESPAWLISKKRFEKSEISFFWLRGKSDESKREFDELIRAQKGKAIESQKQTISKSVIEFFKKFTKKDFVKPLVVIFFATVMLEACGRHIFPAYASEIIGEITGSKSQSFYYTLTIDLITTISATFSSVLVKLLKRRTLLFSTGAAAVVVLTNICVYLFLITQGVILKDKPWIPLSMFIVYFILANLGCTPIPMALLGELFPLAHRGAANSVCGLILSLCLMIPLKVTPFMLISFNVYGTFAIYGTIMASSLLVLYFILPETKDRTLQQIEDYFNTGRFKQENKSKNDEEEMKMITKTSVINTFSTV